MSTDDELGRGRVMRAVELPAVDVAAIEEAIGPLERYAHECGAASVRLVESGLYPGARVARGFARDVTSQHSWVCLGDPYRPHTPVLDLVLWSYVTAGAGGPWVRARPGAAAVWVGRMRWWPHHPHGWGVLWPEHWPEPGDGPAVPLTPRTPLSGYAQMFLDRLGPLDRRGWGRLVHGPMGGWPSGEIIDAVCATRELAVLVPMDIVGMLTDRNPGGAYPRTPEATP